MKDHLTISRFARLRGIDINSLRYYERLGILTPAYTDPQTRYRYYTAEQLSVLDMILLCINLGVPLKELRAYFDESGDFRSRALFEEGRRRTEEKIRELQGSLRGIEHTLNYLEDMSRYAGRQGVYRRRFPQRKLVARAYGGGMDELSELETAFATLNAYARECGMYPVLPMCMLYRCKGAEMSVCWEVSDPDAQNGCIITLAQGEYLCLQTEWESGSELWERAAARLGASRDDLLLLSNMEGDCFRPDVKIVEIQLAACNS